MPVASELVAVVLLCAVASSATSVPVGDEKTVADVCDCGYGTHYGMAAGFECTCGSEADEDCCGLGVSCYDYCSDYTVGGVVNRKKLDDGRVIFKAKLKDSRWDDITKPGGGDEDRWVDKKTGKIEQVNGLARELHVTHRHCLLHVAYSRIVAAAAHRTVQRADAEEEERGR